MANNKIVLLNQVEKSAISAAKYTAEKFLQLTETIIDELNKKQEKISGSAGQVVGFGIDGSPQAADVGGRNLLRNTQSYFGWAQSFGSWPATIENGIVTCSISGQSVNRNSGLSYWIGSGYYSDYVGKPLMLSFDIKSDDWNAVDDVNGATGLMATAIQIELNSLPPYSDTVSSVAHMGAYKFARLGDTVFFNKCEAINGKWLHITTKPFMVNNSLFNTDVSKIGDPYNYLVFRFMLRKNGTVQWRNFKIELGSVATDYTPAPEDKQDKLIGNPGQLIGIGDDGTANGTVYPSNMNIAENWYLANPINRQGKLNYAISTSMIHTLDRFWAQHFAVTLGDEGIILTSSKDVVYKRVQQRFTRTFYAGTVLTGSILVKIPELSGRVDIRFENNYTSLIGNVNTLLKATGNRYELFKVTAKFTSDISKFSFSIFGWNNTSDYIIGATIKAVKVELGDQQTLAHLDADGNWVLNEIPNYAEQYAICSQYDPFTGNFLDGPFLPMGPGGVPYGKELTDSWSELQTRIKAGNFDGIHIGDFKTIELTTGETVVMEVAGIDQYYNCGNPAIGHHIDFISRDCLKGAKVFNVSGTNNGTNEEPNPWRASDLFKTMNDETTGVYSTLPSDLKLCIIEKRAALEKRYSAGGDLRNSTDWVWSDMGKLWLPTEREVWGSSIWSNTEWSGGGGCNDRYPIFIGGTKHIIKGEGNGGSRIAWSEVNAGRDSSTTVCYITGTGNAANYVASTATARVPLCFRIG